MNTLDHEGYLKLFVYYCADCPRAGGMMKNDIKALRLYRKGKAASLVGVHNPDRNPDQLSSYAEQVGLEGAIFAKDTNNTRNISLNNIWQFALMHNGKTMSAKPHTPSTVKDLIASMNPTYRYDVGELETPWPKNCGGWLNAVTPRHENPGQGGKAQRHQKRCTKILEVIDGQFQARQKNSLPHRPWTPTRRSKISSSKAMARFESPGKAPQRDGA